MSKRFRNISPRRLRGFSIPAKSAVHTRRAHDAVNVALRTARAFIHKMNIPHDRAAFVFDIDDTLIFEGRGRAVRAVQYEMLRLFDGCKTLGAVYFITARADAPGVLDFTRRQLVRHGIHGWTDIFLCPDDKREAWTSIANFKHGMRKEIEDAHGRRVVMAVGDRWGDLMRHKQIGHIDRMCEQRAASRTSPDFHSQFIIASLRKPQSRSSISFKVPPT